MTDYTPLLHLPQVAPNQEQKEATINTALAILEAAMNDSVAVSLVAGDVALNLDQFTKSFLHQLTGAGISAARTLTVPATARWFAAENQTNVTVTITTGAVGALNGELGSGHIGLFVSDGADIRAVVPDPASGIGVLSDLANVSGVPTDHQLLRYDAPSQQWTPWTLALAFTQLSDFPGAYISNPSKLLAIKADGSGLEWVTSAANVHNFVDLSDAPNSYSGAANFTVKVNTGGTGLIFARPKLTEATDFPSAYTGAAGKFTRVNPGATGLIFDQPVVADLSDGPGAPSLTFATNYLRVKADGSGLEYATGTGGPQNFTELHDAPAAYTGAANKMVRVNAGATGLVFSTLNFIELADAPANYTGAANKFLRVNGAGNGVTFGGVSVQDLSNGPGAFAGAAKKLVRVNVAASALEYVTLAITDLQFFPTSFTGQGGKFLQVKPDESGVQFASSSVTTNFLALTDSPDSYTGQGGKLVIVDPSETGLSFKTLPMIPTRLGQLADVEDGTGSPPQGAFLRWIDGVWQADVTSVGGGGSGATTLAGLTDVNFTTPPADGQALIYDNASSKWKPRAVAGNFLALTDTPDAYTAEGGAFVKVKADATGLEFAPADLTMAELQDVDFTTPPANGQTITYDGVAGKWKPTGSSAATVLSGLGDVDLSTPPTDGQLLVYDNAAGKWKAKPKQTESFIIALGDETTALTTGAAKVTFRMPYAFTLTAVRASLTTASTTGALTIDIKETGSSVLSTQLSIDVNEKSSTTAVTPAVISDAAIADDAEITFDITVAGTDAAGLKVYLIGHQ